MTVTMTTQRMAGNQSEEGQEANIAAAQTDCDGRRGHEERIADSILPRALGFTGFGGKLFWCRVGVAIA